MQLPFLFLVSALCLLPGNGEVVSSFNKCSNFFFKNKFPNDALKPQSPARICQTYKNKYRFATMYDRKNRIPIYSAYVYNPTPGDRPGDWMIEPQLVKSNLNRNMEVERDSTIPKPDIAASQATFDDYKQAPHYVDKGHLTPVVHMDNEDSKTATFTLTNIVPQYNKLNQGPWAAYETKILPQKVAQNRCTKVYILVGAVPGPTRISGGRVNYPSDMWSAACCEITKNQRKSWGIIASNNQNSPPKVTEVPLRRLELDLEKLYKKKRVDLFGSSCY